MVVRKNVKNLSKPEKSELVGAIKALKAQGKYNLYVVRHAQAPMQNIHRCPAFLPWHRSFLLDLEKDLQVASGNPELAIPYWNWGEDAALADPKTAPVWANDLMGGNGDPADGGIVKTGPFRQGQWQIVNSGGNPAGPLTRAFGGGVPTLATLASIDNALQTLPYDRSAWNTGSNPSFRNRLEGWYGAPEGVNTPGLHNRGHVWVGGSMGPMTSPNDPIFFLHHCFVDMIWANWQQQNPSQNYRPASGGSVGQNLNDLMERTVSGRVTPGDMWDFTSLGYTYDILPFQAGFDAALWRRSNGRIYFFKGNQYIRYSNVSAGLDAGYPRPIAGNWPGLPASFQAGIDASLWRKSNGKIYFFKGNQYVRYSNVSRGVDAGYPKPIAGNWPGLPASFRAGIDAALMRESNGRIYFFKGNQYVRYSNVSSGVDAGYPKPIAGNWPGLPADFNAGLDAALMRLSNGRIYFFKGNRYVRYSNVSRGVDAGYPKPIAGNWPM